MVPAEGAYSTWHVFVTFSWADADSKQSIIGYNFGKRSLDF
jgi:hypothetical protein